MKIDSFLSVLLKYTYFVPVIISFSIFPLQAMNKEQEEITHAHLAPRQIYIVSPEAIEILQKLKLMTYMHPKIAQPTPQIDSNNDFKIAKDHLNFSKKYEAILYAAAVSGTKRELIQASQQVLKNLQTYIATLLKSPCNKFSSEEEQQELETDSYEINYRIGRNHLMLLIASIMTPNSGETLGTKGNVEEIKKIKKGLSGNSTYFKKFQQEIEKTLEFVPSLKALFYPEMKLQPPPRTTLKKIDQQRRINFHQKVSNVGSQSLSKDDCKNNFDPYFHLTVNTIFTKELSLFSKKIPSEEYVQRVQELTEDYIGLEKEGMKFKKSLTGLATLSEPDISRTEELKELYQFFCQRYTLPQKDPLQLLEHVIFMFIHANKLEEALVRTEALKALLLEKGPLSDNFISFRASVMALNGNSGEWRMLLEEKRRAVEKQKTQVHQKAVDRIKKNLKKKKEEQDKTEKEQEKIEHKKETHVNSVKSEAKEKKTLVDSSIYISPPSFENLKSEIVIPQEKVKTRKPNQVNANTGKTKEINENSGVESIDIAQRLPKGYALSKNAFKTYKKIREGNPKFSRMDLYNLFEKLGCTVDISQGKGDHGKIFPPLNMTITNEEGFIGVIPEFIQRDALAGSPLPLTVPNWDEKWDGRVPPYMLKSILKALDYLGATDESVHK